MVNKIIIVVIFSLILLTSGCTHKVDVATKNPIAVDVKMRIDVYHHVQKQAGYIEDMISGKESIPEEPANDNSSRIEPLVVKTAHAQEIAPDKITPRMLEAIKARQKHHQDLTKWESKGVIMENRDGYVQINNKALANYAQNDKANIETITREENTNRKIIHQEVANINNISTQEAGRQFSYTYKERAPEGTWVQIRDYGSSGWVWKQK